jgi:hypothetical protein
MRKHWFAIVCVVSVLAWSAPLVAAQGRGHGKAKAGKSDRAKAPKKAEKRDDGLVKEKGFVIDRNSHRRIVRQYYSHESLPPGLAKREDLPPGLHEQLRERGQLPPGLQKRLVVVPARLGSQLPLLATPYTRYFAGRDLIVVDTRTNEVVALVRDVIVPRR